MSNLPSGTVTFLFTDIEGSTKLAREHRDQWEILRKRHHDILHRAIESHNGYVFQIIGDAFCTAFHTAGDALRAAVKSQMDLASENWGDAPIKVRMGIHTGRAEIQADGQYHGYFAMSRIQRLMSAGHGGQVLISAATQELLLEDLPEDVSLRDLSEHRLKDMTRPEHIYQLVNANLPVDFPPIESLDALPNNLPIQLTSFIGREREIGELKELIERSRLLTLTGVGGTGKTRLALQVAAEVLENFHDGAWFVELAPLTDSVLVPQAITTTFSLREQTGRTFLEILKDYLARKNLLLVLDNCEHLIEACAQIADTLLHIAPYLKILATSREGLGIAGEYSYPVLSLSLPDIHQPLPHILNQFDAVRLFLDRAVAVQPSFQVTNQNAPTVAQICARLDGIPLAIELAAARVKGLSAEQITARLNDRFRLLTGGSRTALPRQRTLQATIDWSYKLLSEEERTLLRRLSVFAGGWTLEAAERVCVGEDLELNQILDLLLRLVEKSLVVADTQEADSRYHMLETIRQYAQEKLEEADESNAARDQHLEYFRALAEQARPHLRSAEQLAWLDRLETEYDNIRAALTWALEGGSVEAGLDLAADLGADIGSFWYYRGHRSEGREFLEKFLVKSQIADRIQALAKGHMTAAILTFSLDKPAALRHAKQSESLWLQLGPARKTDLAHARNWQLFIYTQLSFEQNVEHDPIRVRRGYEENLKVFQEVGDRWMTANSLFWIGYERMRSGDLISEREAFEQSLALFRECGDHIRVTITNEYLGAVKFAEGKYKEARIQYEEVIASYRQMRLNEADSPLWMLGVIAMREEDYVSAKTWYSECLMLDQQLGVDNQIAECFIGFAGIAHAEKQFGRAARLVGAAKGEVEARRVALEDLDQDELERLTTMLRELLGETPFEALAAEGRAMSVEQAIAFALERSDG